MEINDDKFEEIVSQLLSAHGLRFQAIRLKCRRCGEPGLADSVGSASDFGWIDLKQITGPNYEGLCLMCGEAVKRPE